MGQTISVKTTNAQEASDVPNKEVTTSQSGTKTYLDVKATLLGQDIEIGAVEIKDGDSDTRLDVESDGTKNAAFVQANNLDIRDLTSASDSVEVIQDTASDLNVSALIVDSSGNALKINRLSENILGSAGSGGDGDTNRVYTLATSSAVDIIEVFNDGVLLIHTSGWTKDDTAKTVTIKSNVFNSQTVTIWYNV